MQLLRFVFLPILCLTQTACIETPAERDATGGDPNVHLTRGGPRNGYDFVVSRDILARWISEIPEITKGTLPPEVIGRLGKPDEDFAEGPWNQPCPGRCLVYFVAVYRFGDAGDYSEEINLEFDPNNHYVGYGLQIPFHRSDFPDQALSALINKWPVASGFRPAGAPGD
jgi:hypothetical protein